MRDPTEALQSELNTAIETQKCWRCGCFQDAVAAFEDSPAVKPLLGPILDKARGLFQDKRYDCLGCEVCWPAVAINLAADIDPTVAEASCPTEEPEVREGWPPLPGDYRALRYQAPVAVCTLNSDNLIPLLCETRAADIAIVGSLHTENLGIEHIIRNVLANPNIRFLMLCGEDTKKVIGHLPGQSLVSLMNDGVDDNMRIRNAQGKRPIIKNVSREHVEVFRERIQLVDRIGEADVKVILQAVAEATVHNPGPADKAISDTSPIQTEIAQEPARLITDPAGYLVLYPDHVRNRLVIEHYSDKGVLDRVIEGTTPTSLYATVIEAGLLSRLDHAAYLGRELARAEMALLTHGEYVQDRAPGEIDEASRAPTGCGVDCC